MREVSLIHATCQNAAKSRRCCENKIIKVVFIYIQNCAHARLHVYSAVRRNRAASDGDALGRHPTTNTGERDDADDECGRIEKGYVSAVCVSVACGPQMSTRARSQRCGRGVLTFEPSESVLHSAQVLLCSSYLRRSSRFLFSPSDRQRAFALGNVRHRCLKVLLRLREVDNGSSSRRKACVPPRLRANRTLESSHC